MKKCPRAQFLAPFLIICGFLFIFLFHFAANMAYAQGIFVARGDVRESESMELSLFEHGGSENVTENDVRAAMEMRQNNDPKIAGPDIWRIETVEASALNPSAAEMQRVKAYRWVEDGWKTLPLHEIYAAIKDELPTYVYVHGNKATSQDAVMDGVEIMKYLPQDTPYRFIIWHWDTQRAKVRLKTEYREKAHAADMQGVYFACFLQNISSDASVTLIGYSFGARTLLCGLHLCGGGRFSGLAFPENAVRKDSSHLRAVLLASATENVDLLADGRFSHAVKTAKEIHITMNPLDPALKYYPQISPVAAKAMGVTGAVYSSEIENLGVVRHLPVSKKSHKMKDYVALPGVYGVLRTPF